MRLFFFLRPWFWLPAFGAAVSGFFAAGADAATPRALLIVFWIIAGAAAFAETFNDICDEGRDRLGKQYSFHRLSLAGGSGILSGDIISGKQAKCVCVCAAITAISGGLYSASIVLVIITILGLLCATLYSTPFFRAKHNALLGQVLLGIGYGPISFFIGYFASGTKLVDLGVLAISVFIAFWVVVVGITADLLDIDDSLKLGERNLAVRLGRIKTLRLSAIGAIVLLLLVFLSASSGLISIRYYLFLPIAFLTLMRSSMLLVNPGSQVLIRLHLFAILLEASFPLSLR